MMRELSRREYGSTTSSDLKIVRNLIIQKSWSCYTCVWRGTSRKPIYYESGNVYFDNFCHCFRPPLKRVSRLAQLYRVQTPFEDGMCCDRPLAHFEATDAPCFIGITKSNWLHQLRLESGELLHKFYITSAVRFRHISWETEGETIVLKSNLNQRISVDNSTPFLCALAYFRLYPLSFIGMMKVEASVFGDDINDATAMDQILIISHRRGFVRLYSLKYIIKEHLQFQYTCPDAGMCQQPVGFPFNIIVETTPPVLFEIKCRGGDLQIGGFPWQLLTPHGNNYKVTILHTLDSAIIQSTTNSIEQDQVMFHPNGSNHIVHLTATELRILKPNYKNSRRDLKLITLYKLSPNENPQVQSNRCKDQLQVTRSGRLVKPSRNSCDSNAHLDSRTVLAFHYEHNLKMICVLFAASDVNCSTGGQLWLYDSVTGRHLVTIPFLNGVWDEDTTHVIDFDIDEIIHISKSSKSFHLEVYRFINRQES